MIEILRGSHAAAAGLFALAAFTDFLDGWVARWSRATTAAGQYLDPIADKVLLTSVLCRAGGAGQRSDLVFGFSTGAGCCVGHRFRIAMKVSRYNDYTPTIWGKISTLLQVNTAVVVMTRNVFPLAGASGFATAVILVSGLATAWSAVHYTWRGVSFFTRR